MAQLGFMGWIIFVWVAAIAVLGLILLALAKAESYHNALSSHVPDTVEWERRHARHVEERRGSNRVVAPGMRIAPRTGATPGSTAQDAPAGTKPVVTTSSSVVEVHLSSHDHGATATRAASPHRQSR